MTQRQSARERSVVPVVLLSPEPLIRFTIMALGSKTHEGDRGEQIDIKGVSPFFSFSLAHSLDRIEDSMIDNNTIEAVPLRCCKVNSLLPQREVGKIARKRLYLLWVRFLKLLERVLAASNDNKLAFFLEQIVRNREANA